MADSFTEVTYNSLGRRLWRSVGGVLFGLIAFVLAFPVLWWNEGRTNFADVAKGAVEIAPDGAGGAGEGKLVSVTGPVKPSEPVGDPEYLRPGAYLALERQVEMFAWEEEKHEREEKQLGGGSKTITTYDYRTRWTSRPGSSDDFRHPEGHQNPPMRLRGERFFAPSASLGSFTFLPQQVELPPAQRLALDRAVLLRGSPISAAGSRNGEVGPVQPGGDYLFQGAGSMASPRVGDVRISFDAVPPLEVATLFGERRGSTIVAARVGSDDRMLRLLAGDRAQAIATLQTEHSVTSWLLRLVGFLMMWLGASALFGPVNTLLDIVPIVGGMGRFLVTLALFPITLAISAMVIIVSIVAHSLLLMALTALLGLGTAIFLAKRRGAQARPRPAM